VTVVEASDQPGRELGSVAPRLLDGIAGGGGPASLNEHLATYGQLELEDSRELIAEVEASGLQGRGGAGFPTGTKLRAVASRRGRPIVVVNGVEGEPVSGKDKVLLRYLPHLVLDGTVAAARAVGAREATIAIAASARAELTAVQGAVDERGRAGLGGVRVRLAPAPDGFVVGEETALVQFLNRRVAKPTFTPPRPFERGVGGAPTLVQNVETLAHIALIARYGARWFRSLGTPEEPGTALVTLSGAVAEPGVYEVALGTPLAALVRQAGGARRRIRAFLIGGYFGTWVDSSTAADAALSHAGLRPHGARLGARAVIAVPEAACGVCETARVLRYLADSSADQCGPCVNGLDAIARAFGQLAARDRSDRREQLARWIELVRGRGACRHPDGTAALAASALTVFEDEVRLHLHGRCSGNTEAVVPVPKVSRDLR
jgi:NADH:ubiquinone oxidoreductase subunit F (NADH-binding)